MTRQEQKEARREQILNAGLDLFVRNGYHGTTTKDIAETLGISQGLMFHYFKSKDELYIELLTELTKSMSSVTDMLDYTQMNPLEICEKMFAVIIDSFRTYPRAAKYFMLVSQAKICLRLSEEIRAAAKGIESNAFEMLIVAGQNAGVIRDGAPKAMAGLLFSTIQGVAQTYVCFPEIPLPDASWIVDMVKMK